MDGWMDVRSDHVNTKMKEIKLTKYVYNLSLKLKKVKKIENCNSDYQIWQLTKNI